MDLSAERQGKGPLPRLTVLYLLYNAEQTVPDLVRIAAEQEGFQKGEVEFVFIDDWSKDKTWSVLETALRAYPNHPQLRGVRNERNLGLSLTLDTHLKQVRSEYVLTCHCDVFFGDSHYVSRMLALLEKHKDVGAITGQPILPRSKNLPFAERLNLVANLQDVFPLPREQELVSIGFAEGRCDGFRMEALRKVGFYTHHPVIRRCGEDVFLAAKLVRAGYRVVQAPELHYELSASEEQNSVRKLIRHVYAFAEVVPFIVLRKDSALSRLGGEETTANRRDRTRLRLTHLAGIFLYLVLLASLTAEWTPGIAFSGAAILATYILKAKLFQHHMQAIPMSFTEKLYFWALQPFFDVSYALGFIRGMFYLRHASPLASEFQKS